MSKIFLTIFDFFDVPPFRWPLLRSAELSLRKNGLASVFKEVRVFKVFKCSNSEQHPIFRCPPLGPPEKGSAMEGPSEKSNRFFFFQVFPLAGTGVVRPRSVMTSPDPQTFCVPSWPELLQNNSLEQLFL